MSAQGSVTIGKTQLIWDEYKDNIEIRGPAGGDRYFIFGSYEAAREILDCLMVVFGRHDLTIRYPEVR